MNMAIELMKIRNYQKVIKSSLRDVTYYFGFIGNDPAGSLQIPRILSFESKKQCKTTGMRTGEVFALT